MPQREAREGSEQSKALRIIETEKVFILLGLSDPHYCTYSYHFRFVLLPNGPLILFILLPLYLFCLPLSPLFPLLSLISVFSTCLDPWWFTYSLFFFFKKKKEKIKDPSYASALSGPLKRMLS